jgi:SAM-dependent methyltransferase
LTLALAQAGHQVTGIEPDMPSLLVAQAKPGAERVTWRIGTSTILPSAAFDLALMTSHVAQFIADDTEWTATLHDIRRSLVPGGRLAFDSRDPIARAWEEWTPVNTSTEVQLPDGTHARVWNEVERVSGELVVVQEHTVILQTQEANLSSATFRFRTEQELQSSLASSGGTVNRSGEEAES